MCKNDYPGKFNFAVNVWLTKAKPDTTAVGWGFINDKKEKFLQRCRVLLFGEACVYNRLPVHLEEVSTRRSPLVHPEMQKVACSRKKILELGSAEGEILTRSLELDVDDNSSQCLLKPNEVRTYLINSVLM